MKFIMAILSTVFLMISSSAWAHEGIATSHRDAIQKAMQKHIFEVTGYNGNGKFPIFDPTEKTVLQLKFDRLHDSVEIKGQDNPYFVTCADFTGPKGAKYDLDFLVSKNYEVVAVLIHSKNGKHIIYNID